MEENKQHILDLLLPTLQATRDLGDLKNLRYEKGFGGEYVIAEFESGTKSCNVTMDSGVAMVRDVLKALR